MIIFAIAPDDGDDMKHLISAADTAMYKAKNLGKNRYAMASS
ncbi:MAG: diguanylate cyclase [Pseudomonadales bacterium]|nr:diguanylate cyclase [Pseudomonadales bacterium]